MKKVLLTATVQSHICQFHRPLVEMLRESGEFEIHVAARNNLAEKNGLKLDFADKVFDVPFERSPFSPKNIRAYKQLKRLIDDTHYDYIHCNTPVGGLVTRLAAGKSRKQGTQVFYTAHGFHFYKGASWKNWLIYYPVEYWMAKKTDKLITINDEDQRLAQRKFPCRIERIHGVGVNPERYHAVDAEQAAALKAAHGFSPQQRLILCVGELLPNKNQQMAIDAMKQVVQTFPDAVLLLAGNGPQRPLLEQRIREYGLEESVKLLGYCTDLEEYQRISEISVSCSHREGLPLNLIEAMLTENPLVVTHNRGHDELVVDGENGYLLNVDDVDGLADRLTSLLAQPELARRMGACGRERALPYGVPAVKQELKEIYFGD